MEAKRKLIQLSPSTIVISLPSKWIKEHKLTKGDEVHIDSTDNGLFISTTKSKSQKTICLDLQKHSKDEVWRFIDAAYINGYDELQITSNATYFDKLVQYFPGLILFEQKGNTIILKDIATKFEDVEGVINRIFLMIRDWISDTIKDEITDHKKKDYIINSYCSFALRLINKYGYSPSNKTPTITNVIKLLEIQADEYVEIAKSTKKSELQNYYNAFVSLHNLYAKFTEQNFATFKTNRNKAYPKTLKKHMHDLEELLIQLHL